MAHDLILGKINRDWSCGDLIERHPWPEQPGPENAPPSSDPRAEGLFAETRSAIQSNFDTVQRLSRARRLPKSERKEFTDFMSKWMNFGMAKQGTLTAADVATIAQFRDANKQFTERLASYSRPSGEAPKDAARRPDLPTSPGSPEAPPAEQKIPWGWVIALGVGVAGLGYAVGKPARIPSAQ
jgi:hypothetical protein